MPQRHNILFAMLGTIIALNLPLVASAQTPSPETIHATEAQAIPELPSVELSSDDRTLDQSAGAIQFTDVFPDNWAFQSLDELMRRYNCFQGYPDGTFRGDQPVSRDEFAAGLAACLRPLERSIANLPSDFATTEDLDALNRQMQELQNRLGELSDRVHDSN